MSVRIDSLTTEVTAEAPPPAAPAGGGSDAPEWREAAKLAAAWLHRARDLARTSARSFDD